MGSWPLVEPTVIPVVSGTGVYAGLRGRFSAAGLGPNMARLSFFLS